jgi:hypothetical protein
MKKRIPAFALVCICLLQRVVKWVCSIILKLFCQGHFHIISLPNTLFYGI